jgi:hypothetical protein
MTHWPQTGGRYLKTILPNRSYTMIRGFAARLGLRVENRSPRTVQPTSDWIDAAIRREYATGHPRLTPLGRQIDRKPGWIKWRAGVLGLRRPAYTEPHSAWTAAEDALLEECINAGQSIGQMHRRLHAAGYRRPMEGIRSRVWTVHGGFRREYYTASEVSTLFGVDEKLVGQWIHSGKLKARMAQGPSTAGMMEGAGHWHVAPHAISQFMRAHVTLWDHRRMRKEVLIDFLLGENAALGALDQLKGARAA